MSEIKSNAVIVGPYRYHLERVWADEKGLLGFVMLNPSTADHTQDDPTIRKCMGFAHQHGYGGIQVVNLFAYRTPLPGILKQMAREGVDIVGPENDAYIAKVVRTSRLLIAAWGNHGTLQGRDQAVRKMLQAHTLIPRSLGELSKTGQPKHPLYQRYDSALEFMMEAAHAE